ncbi:MAG: endonuclease/exonuclease/phosphatase family protein [Pseudoalteromonas sp.]|uniref:endonuclease/exonuclease/phosphatase family protein n=1 Tax=unclassified Pseudoalteromonas TaxID=194690 RepID=UPI003F96955F
MPASKPENIANTEQLSFATFNLLNYAAPPYSFYTQQERYSQTQWRQKQAFISDFLQQSHADVIAFQEVFSPNKLQALCELHGYSHFKTVESPRCDPLYPQLLLSPVVAIAAKYPIKQCEPLTPSPQLIKYLTNQTEFKFNRIPIKCLIDLPLLGELCCYVVHFKSQRIVPMNELLNVHSKTDPVLTLLESTVGTMQSQIARSLEAAIVYFDALHTQQQRQCATLIMGDFNDNLQSSSLSFINKPNKAHRSTNKKPALTTKNNPALEIALTDAYLLSENSKEAKPITHYHHTKGNVLDYILISEHFNPKSPYSKVAALRYQSFDKHLNPMLKEEDLSTSDHSAISITLTF